MSRGWTKCVVQGCRKKQIKYSSWCATHDKELKDGGPEKPERARTPKPDVLTALCAAVSAKYADEGDKIKAGVVISCLQHDPPVYYASVARYPDSPYKKDVVISTGRIPREPLRTAEEAVGELAQKWLALHKPQPVAQTLSALENALAPCGVGEL